jgi:hypothetical protein
MSFTGLCNEYTQRSIPIYPTMVRLHFSGYGTYIHWDKIMLNSVQAIRQIDEHGVSHEDKCTLKYQKSGNVTAANKVTGNQRML